MGVLVQLLFVPILEKCSLCIFLLNFLSFKSTKQNLFARQWAFPFGLTFSKVFVTWERLNHRKLFKGKQKVRRGRTSMLISSWQHYTTNFTHVFVCLLFQCISNRYIIFYKSKNIKSKVRDVAEAQFISFIMRFKFKFFQFFSHMEAATTVF